MPDRTSELLKSPYWFYLIKHKWTVLAGTVWLFLTNYLDTLIPALVGSAIDAVAKGDESDHVLNIVVMIFGCLIGLSIFRYLWRVFWGRFHHTVAEDLRNRVFDRMADLGPSFFRTRKVGQMIALISHDVNSFRMGIGPGVLILLDGLFLVVLILPRMLEISSAWTWQTLALMPFVPFVVKGILDRLHQAYHARQERFSELSSAAQEAVSGIRVVKSYAQEESQTRKFNEHSDAFRLSTDRVAFWDSLFGPSLELPVALGSVVLLIVGAERVISGQVSIGEFVAFYQYIQRMVWPMSAIGIALGHIQEGRASFRRIREVLVLEPDVPDTGSIEVNELESLEVRSLTFTYPGAQQPALQGISFKLERGECLGVVGMTGAGKSTLIDLLTRQYPVAPGTILVNGISVEKIKLSSLRRLIGVVPQDAFLFSRQVDENLALGKEEWNLEDVRGAARDVSLDREIESWPGQYAALVGERGVNLSGGQKQRMTLARAMMRQAPLVILDDSLSAVDAKTEEVILTHLRNELRKTTSIIVSHRLNSVRAADQILVLKAGQTEGLGRHEELVRGCATYQTLHEMQSEGRTR